MRHSRVHRRLRRNTVNAGKRIGTIAPRSADGERYSIRDVALPVSNSFVAPAAELSCLAGIGQADNPVFAFGGRSAWIALGRPDGTLSWPRKRYHVLPQNCFRPMQWRQNAENILRRQPQRRLKIYWSSAP